MKNPFEKGGPVGRFVRKAAFLAGAGLMAAPGHAQGPVDGQKINMASAEAMSEAKINKMKGLLRQAELNLEQEKRKKTPDEAKIDELEDRVEEARTNLEEAKGEYKDKKKENESKKHDTAVFHENDTKKTEAIKETITRDGEGRITERTVEGTKKAAEKFGTTGEALVLHKDGTLRDATGNIVSDPHHGGSGGGAGPTVPRDGGTIGAPNSRNQNQEPPTWRRP